MGATEGAAVGPSHPTIVVDAANVVGSRPDGWWRDRPGAAERLVRQVAAWVAAADRSVVGRVVVVLEGAARPGVAAGTYSAGVEVVHAEGSGDDEVVRCTAAGVRRGEVVGVVTADRGLRARVEPIGASCVSPRWLREQVEVSSAG